MGFSMSLQVLLYQMLANSAQRLNLLALFFAVAGSWLLLATRWREQTAGLRLAAGSGSDPTAAAGHADESTRRINRFFYRFGYGCLVVAVSLSWCSTWS